MRNKIFTLHGVSHAYRVEGKRSQPAFADIELGIEQGEFLSIVGPSGCGKSTLLRVIAGLIKPTKGTLERRVGALSMVFQNFALFPWLTVEENIEFGLLMQGEKPPVRQHISRKLIAEVGLTGVEKKYPKELSGGMRQRVGIARALAITPEVLLLDEPFSALDPFTTAVLKKDIFEIWRKYKLTVIMVTHSVPDAYELSTNLVVLSRRPGRIIEDLAIADAYPRNLRSERAFRLIDEVTAKIEDTQES